MSNESKIRAILKLRNEVKKLSRQQEKQLDFARSFVADIIMDLYTPLIGSPTIKQSHPLASKMKELFSVLDIDTAAYFIGTVYTAMLPVKYRSDYGAYYTPPALTERLLDMTEDSGVDWGSSRIVDPACGGGAFLAPVARRVLKKVKHLDSKEKLNHLKTNLQGFEIDPFSAWMSKVFLEVVIREECDVSSSALNEMVCVRDSLKDLQPFYGEYDLVVGNPPYGKVKLDKGTRDEWSRSLYGHANLYALFTDLGLKLVKKGGLISFVTPASFLGGQYFKALRSLLTTKAYPLEINFIASREGVFADVLQETLLSVYKANSKRKPVKVAFLDVKENGYLKIEHGGAYNLSENKEAPWMLPRSYSQGRTILIAQNKNFYLKNLGYKVSTGPLVWNRHKEKLKTKKCKNCIPVIWAESINSSGVFNFKVSGKNHSAWYVSESKEKDANIIKQSCILLQRTSSTEQNRRLSCAVLPQSFIDSSGGHVVIENHINMIKHISIHAYITQETLIVFLNSNFVDQIFRCINGSTAVSAYELESMPIPSPEDFMKFEHLIINDKTPAFIENAIKEMYLDVCTKIVA